MTSLLVFFLMSITCCEAFYREVFVFLSHVQSIKLLLLSLLDFNQGIETSHKCDVSVFSLKNPKILSYVIIG